MAQDGSMLAHLAWMFVVQRENLAIEALGYLLRDSRAVGAINALLREGGADMSGVSEFNTQVTYDNWARPDLVGLDADGNRPLIIEAKFWAELTDKQPAAYLQLLPRDRPSALLFIAPESRFDTLWRQLESRARAAGFSMTTTMNTSTIRNSRISGGNRYLMMTSWTSVLDRLQSVIGIEGALAEDLRQLRSLCRQEEAGGMQVTADMSDQDGINTLRKLVNESLARGLQDGYLNSSGLAWGKDARYIRFGGADRGPVARFGWNFDRMNIVEHATPLWVDFVENTPEDMKPSEVRPYIMGEIVIDDSVPVYLRTGVEYSLVLDAVEARLRYIAALLKGSD